MKMWQGRWMTRGLVGLVLASGAIASTDYGGISAATAQVLVPAGSAAEVTLTDEGVRFEGQTSGEYGLMRLAGRDRRRRLCLGYGSQDPDHVLVLSEAVNRLSLVVESEGDTTLLVEGPRGIDCNDNYQRNSRDAAVRGGQWPAGTYRIWVGAFEQGERIDYELTVSSSGSNAR